MSFKEIPPAEEKWDPETKTLHVATNHSFAPDIEGIYVSLNSGTIRVTKVESYKSTLRSHLTIKADSEAAARREKEKRGGSFIIKGYPKHIEVDGSSESAIFTDEKGNKTIVKKDSIDSIPGENKMLRVIMPEEGSEVVVDRGEIAERFQDKVSKVKKSPGGSPLIIPSDLSKTTIDGKPISPEHPALSPIEVRREVNIFVSTDTGEIPFLFETQHGDVSLHGIQGKGSITPKFSGDVNVQGFEGTLKIESLEGDTNVIESKGLIDVKAKKKDVTFDTFDGTAVVSTKEGNITMHNALLRETTLKTVLPDEDADDEVTYIHDLSTMLSTEEGKIDVAVKNDKLDVSAITKGDIQSSDEFHMHPGYPVSLGEDKKLIRGDFGKASPEDSANKANFKSDKGNIIIRKDA